MFLSSAFDMQKTSRSRYYRMTFSASNFVPLSPTVVHKVTTRACTSQDVSVKAGALATNSYTPSLQDTKVSAFKLGKEIRGEVTKELTANADVENMVALTVDSRQSWEARCIFKAQRTG